MTRTHIILWILTLIIFIPGCIEKDVLTLPVKVDFRIILSEKTIKDDYLSFTGGEAAVQKILFEGRREAGENVYFETDPRVNFPSVTFSDDSQNSTVTDFDIPQGIYNYMRWDIYLKEIIIEELIGDDDDNDDDDPHAGLSLTGFYTNLSGNSIPFILAIDIAEQFNVRSYDADGNSTIVLSVDKDYEAIMSIDPAYTFGSISRESLEDADITDYNGMEIIIISGEENEDIYEILSYRIAQSAKIMVK